MPGLTDMRFRSTSIVTQVAQHKRMLNLWPLRCMRGLHLQARYDFHYTYELCLTFIFECNIFRFNKESLDHQNNG